MTWTTGMFLRTPTLRSGGLKLSYINYGKCGSIHNKLEQFPLETVFLLSKLSVALEL